LKKTPSIYTTIADLVVEYGLYAIVLGLFLSNALKSIGCVSVALSILLHNNTLRNWKILLKNKLYTGFCLLAIIYVLSILNSGNFQDYWELSRNKWLFFFFPVALLNLKQHKTIMRNMLYIGIACGLFQTFYSLYYLIVYDSAALKQIYSTGNIINSFKIHHVQIAILYSILILQLFILFLNERKMSIKTIGIGLLLLWFFIAVHVYAVRSGILLTYIFLTGYSFIRFKRISVFNKVVFVLLIVLGGSLFFSLSTVQNRLGYLKYDLQQYLQQKSDAIEYSDGRRLISINVGLQLIKENKWLGSGLGNINEKTAAIYKRTYPQLDASYYFLPHSQYIFFAACFGIVLGALVCLLFIYPCYYFLQQKSVYYFLICFGLLIFALWDAWLGTLFGNTLYILIVSFGIKETLIERTTYH
jgi:hypothetical protein